MLYLDLRGHDSTILGESSHTLAEALLPPVFSPSAGQCGPSRPSCAPAPLPQPLLILPWTNLKTGVGMCRAWVSLSLSCLSTLGRFRVCLLLFLIAHSDFLPALFLKSETANI